MILRGDCIRQSQRQVTIEFTCIQISASAIIA